MKRSVYTSVFWNRVSEKILNSGLFALDDTFRDKDMWDALKLKTKRERDCITRMFEFRVSCIRFVGSVVSVPNCCATNSHPCNEVFPAASDTL